MKLVFHKIDFLYNIVDKKNCAIQSMIFSEI